MGRVVHFEIHADDPERAVAFYTQAFGWQARRWMGGKEPYWLLATGPPTEPGIDGGVLRRRSPLPASSGVVAFVCTIDVDDLDRAVEAVTEAGGSVVVPRQAVPSVGHLAYCRDTEGNVFGLLQSDRSVAADEAPAVEDAEPSA